MKRPLGLVAADRRGRQQPTRDKERKVEMMTLARAGVGVRSRDFHYSLIVVSGILSGLIMIMIIVKLREREGKRVNPGRSLKGHL